MLDKISVGSVRSKNPASDLGGGQSTTMETAAQQGQGQCHCLGQRNEGPCSDENIGLTAFTHGQFSESGGFGVLGRDLHCAAVRRECGQVGTRTSGEVTVRC